MMHSTNSCRFIFKVIGALIAVISSTAGVAQVASSSCGDLRPPGQFGPFDYRTGKSQLPIVEGYHFTPAVEALIRGSTGELPGADLDYTLRAFPNHHKALISLVGYGEKMKSPQPPGLKYSVECYFERALRFQPDDTIVRMLYARFLAKLARSQEAKNQLEQATTLAGDNAFSHYNIGLIYFDFKEYEKALVQAHKAIALGFMQPALREQLKAVGKWTSPTEPPTLPPTVGTENSPSEPISAPAKSAN